MARVYFEQIDRLGLAGQVTVENEFVEDERLRAWVKAADVVTLPYRSATQSAVVQLALGLGTPVITTRVGGLVEAIEVGVNGLLVNGANSAEFAQAIIAFLDNPIHLPTPPSAHDSWKTLADTLCGIV